MPVSSLRSSPTADAADPANCRCCLTGLRASPTGPPTLPPQTPANDDDHLLLRSSPTADRRRCPHRASRSTGRRYVLRSSPTADRGCCGLLGLTEQFATWAVEILADGAARAWSARLYRACS